MPMEGVFAGENPSEISEPASFDFEEITESDCKHQLDLFFRNHIHHLVYESNRREEDCAVGVLLAVN